MKCLIINGSPRKGNTWKLVERVKRRLIELGDVEFDEVMLLEQDIPFCRGCFGCFANGEAACPHADKVQPIDRKLRACDMLIVTSPVYALGMSGLLKNLFDHTAYLFHRPSLFGVHALVISSTTGAAAKKVAKDVRDTLLCWGVNRAGIVTETNFGQPASAKTLARCDRAAERLYADAQNGKLYAPDFKRAALFNAWRCMSQTSSAFPADRRYWLETGMTGSLYAPGVPIGPLKRALGRLAYYAMHKLLSGTELAGKDERETSGG